MTKRKESPTTVVRRVGTYRRVSTDEQAREGTSLETQLAELHEEVRTLQRREPNNDYLVVKDYSDDGYSGTNDKRPGLRRLMADARAGKINMVLVYKLDRFMRNTRLLLQYLEEFAELRISFVPLDCPGMDPTGYMGKAMITLLSLISEFEPARMMERIKEGKARKKAEGKWAYGQALYGYAWDKEKGQFTLVKDRVEIVRRVFGMYTDRNMSYNQIATTLNEEGYVTPRRRPFRDSTIHAIVSDIRYTGEHEHYDYPPHNR